MFFYNEQKAKTNKISLPTKRRTSEFFTRKYGKNMEDYRKLAETKENKQLAEVKKILQGAKNSYEALTKENKQLKE